MQIGLGGLVFLVLLTLKLLDKVTWSWWWVTSPLWIAALLTILGLVFLLVVSLRADAKADKSRRALQEHLSGRRRKAVAR